MRYTSILLLSFYSISLGGQSVISGYNLEKGAGYFLSHQMTQNTIADNNEHGGNVTLDINGKILFTVLGTDSLKNYLLECRYNSLEINFFSPRPDTPISSGSNTFRSLYENLKNLEKETFTVLMSREGQFLIISGLDSCISGLPRPHGNDIRNHDLIVKTIREAFGESALKSMADMVLNTYNAVSPGKSVKESAVFFNAKELGITNSFYILGSGSENVRIQGIGIIQETIDTIVSGELLIKTMSRGNQTYDYLCSNSTGWIIQGISKQKIQSLSVFYGHAELPDGLKVPSFTEAEYRFQGGRLPGPSFKNK